MTKFLIVSVGMLLGALTEGFALKTLWAWFIVPTFGLASLAFVPAIGVALVAKAFTGAVHTQAIASKSDGGTEAMLEATVRGILVPLVTLGVGWVWSLFM